jgi:hypothetical protein
MKSLKASAAYLTLALLFPTLALAQTEGRFVGVVLDPTGAVIPSATVVVKNERTGDTRTVTSNAEGRYIVPNLPPSTYTIKATSTGLAPLECTGLQLVAAQEFALDLSLTPAGITETVTVQANFQTVDMSSARIGVNVSEREISELPVNGRQMSQLMLQAPGSQNAGTGTWNDVRFSGRANNQNVIKFDGVEGSAIIDASPGNLGGQIPSPFKLQASLENVQEFRVESNNYPAEFGTGTGGQVSVVTKSGSNLWRGSIFEYYRDDSLDAPNYFDSTRNSDGSVIDALPKSKLNQHQFGGSFGGPIVKNKVFFFGSYEGYRLDAGVNFVEASPSDAAWARAVPAVQPLRPGFVAPGAVLIPGVSTNTDYDIFQLQGLEQVDENSFSMRLDYRMNQQWSSYVRVFNDRGEQLRPEGISGRVVRVKNEPTNAIFNLQGTFGSGLLNEFKIGYNGPSSNVRGIAPTVPGVDMSNIAISLTGSVANTGIAGQAASSGIVVPGGLVRASSATNGREVIYDPFSIALSDSASLVRGNHLAKLGGDVRMIRMTTDQLGGTTYSYSNLANFLTNTPAQIQYLGDISAPSVFNNGAAGMRHTSQQYYTAYAQDEWHATPNLTLNYGLRYEYYTPLKERDNLIVKFNIETGQIEPNTTPLHGSKKDSIQPRLSATYALGSKTVLRGGYGIFVGPGQGEDLIQPIESDRVSTTLTTGQFLAFPINQDLLVANFTNNPNNRSYQPRAYAQEYAIPEKVHQYTASVQQELGNGFATTVGYVGSQGRNLFLRSVANNIVDVATNPNPANAAFIIREFSIVSRDANGHVTGVQNPYAEVDFKTSGGKDSYNALMWSLNRRSVNGIATNVQYTFATSRGTSGGSNEANTAGNNARTLEQFDYEDGHNNFDVRHTFNVSLLYSLPFGRGRRFGSNATPLTQALLGGWEVGGIYNARSGVPINVLLTRPDILYRDSATGLFYTGPAAGRVAVINTPGGGQSRNVRRPDLAPGVDPFIKDGGLIYLNPAAFAAPLPGTFGNMERNSVHGPNFHQMDFFFAKQFATGARSNAEFRMEVFNMLNTTNFANPSGTLNAAVPGAPGQANTLQPGEAYTAAAAGPAFGRMTSTVGRTVGLGTPRQVQLALRYQF